MNLTLSIKTDTIFSLHPTIARIVKEIIFTRDSTYTDALLAAMRKIEEKISARFVEELSTDEILVLTHVNGEFTVQDILEYTNLEEKHVIEYLSNLESKDLIRRKSISQLTVDKKSAMVNLILKICIVLSFSCSLLLLDYNIFKEIKNTKVNKITTPDSSEILISNYHMNLLKIFINLFDLENNQYPEKIEDLINYKLVEEKALSYPFEENYYYQKRGSSYLLLLPKL